MLPLLTLGRRRGLLFDHFVGKAEKGERHAEHERLGSPEIDNEPIFSGRLYREVARLGTVENAIDVACCLSVLIEPSRSYCTPSGPCP
jgi:hypothetical protein